MGTYMCTCTCRAIVEGNEMETEEDDPYVDPYVEDGDVLDSEDGDDMEDE